MLPFLNKDKNRMVTTLLDRRSGNRTEIQPTEESKDSANHDQDLEAACAKLLTGIERKSVQDIRDALREAFECLESQPHEEYSDED
jgi:hypothetical protein